MGFVGARSLPEETAWLVERLTEVWATSATWSAPESVELSRLASGMANGADSLAVTSYCDWRDSHSAQPHELLLIYPCAVNDFKLRSEETEIAGFDARRTAVIAKPNTFELVLDGEMPRSRPDPAAGKAINDEQMKREKRIRAAAHCYQSEVLIRQCEFLVAVIDREQEGEAGGTRETIQRGMSLDTPVLVIDPASQDVFVLRYIEELRADYVPSDDWRDVWRAVLKSALSAPSLISDAKHSLRSACDPQPGQKQSTRWDAFERPFRVYAQTYEAELLAVLIPASETNTSSSEKKPAQLKLSEPSPWQSLSALTLGVAGLFFAGPTLPEIKEEVLTVAHWRRQVGTSQTGRMAEYRSLFISNYWLGLLAVVLALVSLSILAMGKPGPWSLVALFSLAVAKFGIVWKISDNTQRAEETKAGKLSVELRYIAERLRVMPNLIGIGSARVDLVHQTSRQGPAHHVTEDFVRRLPLEDSLPIGRADAMAPGNSAARRGDSRLAIVGLIQLINDQIAHHASTHAKMSAVHRMLERGIATCGGLVIWIVGIDIVVIIAKLILNSQLATCLVAEAWIVPIGKVLSIVGVALVFITALLPALMATLNGILFQSQAEQLADRHGAMAGALSLLLVEARQLQTHAPTFGISASHAVLNLSERTYRLMAEEVGEWATMYSQGLRET